MNGALAFRFRRILGANRIDRGRDRVSKRFAEGIVWGAAHLFSLAVFNMRGRVRLGHVRVSRRARISTEHRASRIGVDPSGGPIRAMIHEELNAVKPRITLDDIEPPIWRRLVAPLNWRLDQLHLAIQAAFNWWNFHLHEFCIGGLRYGDPDVEDVAFEDSPRLFDEREVTLRDFGRDPSVKFVYTYDFGDTWEHTVAVEKVLPPDPGVAYPTCTGGKRRCPPEDCGGPYGYHNLLETLGDPANEEHESMLEWVGGSFDPEAFSVEGVNQRLAPPKRRRTRAVSQSI